MEQLPHTVRLPRRLCFHPSARAAPALPRRACATTLQYPPTRTHAYTRGATEAEQERRRETTRELPLQFQQAGHTRTSAVRAPGCGRDYRFRRHAGQVTEVLRSTTLRPKRYFKQPVDNRRRLTSTLLSQASLHRGTKREKNYNTTENSSRNFFSSSLCKVTFGRETKTTLRLCPRCSFRKAEGPAI